LAVPHGSKRAVLPAKLEAPKKRMRRAFQIAALVHRWNANELEVLLVTSRETRRWILPKGWPIDGKTAPATAEQEAQEEAGVVGHAMKKPLGRYSAIKRIGETVLPCELEVYAVQFVKQKQKWKERGERSCVWLPAAVAADTVAEPELAEIIRSFAEDMQRNATISRSA
jgi:8-oxo-dGTP pyrophosphatase MutT (NUDIX family)